jgi:hypothetical protein
MSETKENGGCEFQGQCEQDKDGPRADYCPLEKVVFDQTAMIKRMVEGLEDIGNLSTNKLYHKWICTVCEEAEQARDFSCKLTTPVPDKPTGCPYTDDDGAEWRKVKS